MSESPPAMRFGYSCCLLFGILFVGCSEPIELKFASREELHKLPEKHQQQLLKSLEDYYGTARFPVYHEVAPADQQPENAETPKLIETRDRRHLQLGQAVYLKQCAGCHGVTGDGQGPAAKYLDPPPRDYRLGKFKFTSTPRGSKPRKSDLVRVLRRGAKGTSMPAFRWMPEEELNAVIDYVVLLSSRGEMEYRLIETIKVDLEEEDDVTGPLVAEQAVMIAESWAEAEQKIVRPITPEMNASPESIVAGAKAFVRMNCYKCHGREGHGIKASNVGKDDWGRIAYAADLTAGTLHGGGRPVDIYRRIYSGINGTPMPGFSQPDSSQNETEAQRSETIWNLAHFVRSIAEGKPLPLDVIDHEIREMSKGQSVEETEASATESASPDAPK